MSGPPAAGAAAMRHVPLGGSDLVVSRIALGCMGFADPARGVNPWALHELVAAGRGISMAQVALAWVLGNPVVAAPVVGVTSPAQLDDAVAALAVHLDDAEVDELESRYSPALPRGF